MKDVCPISDRVSSDLTELGLQIKGGEDPQKGWPMVGVEVTQG